MGKVASAELCLRSTRHEFAKRDRDALSSRQAEVLALVASGSSSKEIAAVLRLSRSTVESHVRASMAKLGAATRLHAVALAGLAIGGSLAFTDLSPDQVALFAILARGSTVQDAAAQLGISRRTATRRLNAARRRLAVEQRAESELR